MPNLEGSSTSLVRSEGGLLSQYDNAARVARIMGATPGEIPTLGEVQRRSLGHEALFDHEAGNVLLFRPRSLDEVPMAPVVKRSGLYVDSVLETIGLPPSTLEVSDSVAGRYNSDTTGPRVHVTEALYADRPTAARLVQSGNGECRIAVLHGVRNPGQGLSYADTTYPELLDAVERGRNDGEEVADARWLLLGIKAVGVGLDRTTTAIVDMEPRDTPSGKMVSAFRTQLAGNGRGEVSILSGTIVQGTRFRGSTKDGIGKGRMTGVHTVTEL